MEHQVRFLTAEGREAHHTAENLDEALRFVERLRNTEGATNVRVFRTQEIPIEFRTYYKVELRVGEGGGEDAAISAPVDADDADDRSPEAVATTNGAVDADGDTAARRLFSRG